MDNKYIDLIEKLTSAPGPSGYEDAVVEIARRYCESFAETRENSMRNLYISRPENTGNGPVVMLDAHSDEVGFMVKGINPNGTLSFIELGGIRRERHEGQRVKVRNADGTYLTGMISCCPPHFGKNTEGQQVIDVGATSAAEAERMGVRVGAPCVPDSAFHCDGENGLIFAKALDCRLGCAALLAVLEQLKNTPLAVDTEGVFSSQEEIGGRGALVATQTLKPQAAIVFEAAPADDTYAPPHERQAALRKGPMLRLIDSSMVANPRFAQFAIDLAAREGIPVQVAVRSGGGTNAGKIHTVGDGVPTLVISIPVRYIHAPNGIAAYEDFESAVKLAIAILKVLDEETIRSF